MLDNGIIRPSRSPMSSPLVCVLRGKEGCDGVCLAVDYRYVNCFTRDDVYPLPDISSVFQRTGRCNFVTVADCKAGYWQIPMSEKGKWLTAFVCDARLFESNWAPFGLKGLSIYLSILWAGVQPTLDPYAEAFIAGPLR